jgi:hypothetical protein
MTVMVFFIAHLPAGRRRGGRGERFEGNEVLEVLVDQLHALGVAEDVFEHFIVEPGAGDPWVAEVLVQHPVEAGHVALGLVDALHRVALGLGDHLVGHALGLGDGVVVGFLPLVDQPAPVLDGLVHVLEGVLDRSSRRHDVLQLDRGHPDAQVVLVIEPVHDFLGLGLDVGPFGADHVEDSPVADQLVQHRLGDVPDGLVALLHPEQPFVGIGDAELDDPLHVHDVQVAGQHDRLVRVVLRGAD